ncbi:unnamed protein product [Symbiodinium sp. CCMP2592]|nr:unnamed protein product [Symbiodinium sp. CCMP2592]
MWPQSPAALKDGTLWTRKIHLEFSLQVFLWLPPAQQLILHLLPAGSEWDPAVLSFGDFQRAFAGAWVPVVWSPSQWIHLVQASEVSHTANVLVESCGELTAQSVGRIVSPQTFAADRGLDAPRLGPLGVPRDRVIDRWHLRDGDVVYDHSGPASDYVVWDVSRLSSSISLPLLALLLGGRGGVHAGLSLSLLAFISHRGGAVRDRSRSARRHSDTEEDCSVAMVGRWRPELPQPLAEVVSSQRWDYHILCPFRGWSSCIHAAPTTPHDALQSMVDSCSGPWARGHVVLGPSRITGSGIVLPIAGSGLASIVAHAGDTTRAVLVPRVCRLHTLLDCCRRFLGAPGDRLSLPPALTYPQMAPDALLQLRDGDSVVLEMDHFNRACRVRPDAAVHDLYRLNHLSLWNSKFKVRKCLDAFPVPVRATTGRRLQGNSTSGTRDAGPLSPGLTLTTSTCITRLLGIPDGVDSWPPLRDGDILHVVSLRALLPAPLGLCDTGCGVPTGDAWVKPQPWDAEVHWVPRATSADLATVLVLGRPGPAVITLPCLIQKALFLSKFCRVISLQRPAYEVITQPWDPPPRRPLISLCVMVTYSLGPSLPFYSTARFDSPLAAQRRGLWSQDLTFEGSGVVLLHRSPDALPIVVPLTGPQRWNAKACSLHPALLAWPDAWWPCPFSTYSQDGLHLRSLADFTVPSDDSVRPCQWASIGDSSDYGWGWRRGWHS